MLRTAQLAYSLHATLLVAVLSCSVVHVRHPACASAYPPAWPALPINLSLLAAYLAGACRLADAMDPLVLCLLLSPACHHSAGFQSGAGRARWPGLPAVCQPGQRAAACRQPEPGPPAAAAGAVGQRHRHSQASWGGRQSCGRTSRLARACKLSTGALPACSCACAPMPASCLPSTYAAPSRPS